MSEPVLYPALLLLGHALRELREKRRVSLRGMATRLGFSPQHISAWELGRRRPPAEALGFILGFLQVRPSQYRQLTRIHQQGDRLNCVEELDPDTPSLRKVYEELAVRKFEWVPHRVPEYFETPEYIEAKLRRLGAPPDDIDQAIFAQQVHVLDRPKHYSVSILVSEAAWASTIDLPRLKNVTASIVPTDACPPGTIEGFTIYLTESGASTVVLQHQHAQIYLGEPQTVHRYRSTFNRLLGLSAGGSGARWAR